MRLTVLGAGPACQNPGGACSSYLLENGDTAIVLDCGSGSFGRLQRYVPPERVRATIISHMHADHTLDLLQYRYYLYFARTLTPDLPSPGLFLPPEGHRCLLGVSAMQDQSPTFFSDTFSVREYDPLVPLQIGSLRIEFVPVVHIKHTYAMRVTGEATLAFSADSGPCPALIDVARGSDLFLCECANIEGSDYPYHLTPRQAGTIAREGGARRLLLTHRWSAYGEAETIAQARETFPGPVALAHEDMQITIAR